MRISDWSSDVCSSDLNLEGRHAAGVGDLDLDFLVVELAVAQLVAEGTARGLAGVGADQGVEHALLGGELGLRLDRLALLGARHVNGHLEKKTGSASGRERGGREV